MITPEQAVQGGLLGGDSGLTRTIVHTIAMRVGLGVGVLLVVGPSLGRELRRRFVAKTNQQEQDEIQAERAQESGEIAKRVRIVAARPKPTWLKKLERKWNAAGRRGNQILNGSKQ